MFPYCYFNFVGVDTGSLKKSDMTGIRIRVGGRISVICPSPPPKVCGTKTSETNDLETLNKDLGMTKNAVYT